MCMIQSLYSPNLIRIEAFLSICQSTSCLLSPGIPWSNPCYFYTSIPSHQVGFMHSCDVSRSILGHFKLLCITSILGFEKYLSLPLIKPFHDDTTLLLPMMIYLWTLKLPPVAHHLLFHKLYESASILDLSFS